jgi:exosortase
MPEVRSIAAHRKTAEAPVREGLSQRFIAPGLFLLALWLEVIHHLSKEWSVNPQYSYGWSVPLLAVYMFWRRWPSRPPARAWRGRLFLVSLLVLGTVVIIAVRFVAEANPDWRLLSWIFALAAVALSFAALTLLGGSGWVRHFAFPVFFTLVAVPWPTSLEQMITQDLMRAVTAINVFGLNLVGIPALQRGNVIEVASGLIGIEEACSGVRSLQATLMISLFLGELYSFDIARRALLVSLGAILAFGCNLVRTAILVWVGANRGVDAIHGWHDPAGFSILIVCLAGLWLLSLWLGRGAIATEAPLHSRSDLPRPPVLSFALLTACLLLGEVAVQMWYSSHESSLARSRWSIRWPRDQSAYQEVAVAPETQGMLRYNEGGGATWKGEDSRQWVMYFFRWLPGRTAALFVKNHRPDVCLPASGMTMRREESLRLETINGVRLPVRSYRFEQSGTPLHVLYCYWDARALRDEGSALIAEDWTPAGRIQAALHGRREVGTQMLEIAVWGYEDDAEAAAALRQRLQTIVTSI